MTHPEPRLGGLEPFSSCDWPGKLAAVVFIAGCPWRCGYCHNPHLQARRSPEHAPAWPDVLALLAQRRGLLDGVVFSGGEALSEPLLPDMIRQVRALGFATALHTGGAYPQRLQECLPLLDWVGFDIKHEFDAYESVTGKPGSGAAAQASLALLQASGVAYECRTTIHPLLHDDAALQRLGHGLQQQGVSQLTLQRFRREGCADAQLNDHPIPAGYPQADTLATLEGCFSAFSLRG